MVGFRLFLCLLKSDLWRHRNRANIPLLIKSALVDRTFRPVATLRLCQYFNSGNRLLKPFLPLGKLLHRLACSAAAIDFPWETKIGHGFKITHGWAAVVNGNAVIGSNVTMMHGVTIGGRAGGYPVIGDDVFIGPNVTILGGITIGKGSIIQAGSVVVYDIPENCMVGSVPARSLKQNCVAEVPNRASFEMFYEI